MVARQVVGGVVGGAEGPHVELRQDAVGAQIVRWRASSLARSQMRGALRLVEQLVDAEIALQLQVGPVIQRIAQRIRNGARPGQEFFVRRRVAGAIALVDAVGAHGPPFVVVAFQPDLEQIAELPVVRHVLGRQVAMIVQNGFVLGEFMIEAPRVLVCSRKSSWMNDIVL